MKDFASLGGKRFCSYLFWVAISIGAPFFWSISEAPGAEEEMISAEEFRASVFAELFQEGDYQVALSALDPLLERYPDDSLLLRYRGMTLDRLGRSREAIEQFKEILEKDTDHVPTRYFLGQAYERAGMGNKAAEEWRWVVEHSPVPEYRQWAETALARAGVPEVPLAAPKRWFLAGIAGWEWDSNVTLKPDDKALANTGDKNADRFSATLRLGYHLIQERDLGIDLLYTGRQSAHDDSLDDLNFNSQEASLDARKRALFFGKEVTWGSRYDLMVGLLESDLFSLTNRLTLSADTRLSPRTRTVLTNRLAWSDFGPDGSNPSQTSRDGFYGDFGITQYFYTADFQRHLFLTEEYNDTRTRGGNFERRGTTTRIGIHTPLPWIDRVEADLATGFRWNKYPRFSSLSTLDTARRRDTIWDVYMGLTYPLNPKLSSRVFYRFADAKNRNDLFEYGRHVSGVQLLF